jgi:hypothetical protein
MLVSPVPTSARKRIGLKGHIDSGSPAKKARQETPPHVSTGALADLYNGSGDIREMFEGTVVLALLVLVLALFGTYTMARVLALLVAPLPL